MKMDEIRRGVTYTKGKSQRRIVDFWPQYKLYDSQSNPDCLAYAVVNGRHEPMDRGRTEDGLQIQHSTRASFAAWAKAEVTV